MIVEDEKCIQNLVEKSQGKWEDNIFYQNRVQCYAVVNMAMNLWAHKRQRIS